ncbi:hypothetical protein MMC15_002317 [Xylographa vitiligo]|nr:hypothetical protein [Xylographa vitiligo]
MYVKSEDTSKTHEGITNGEYFNRQALSADQVALDIARQDYKKVADLAKFVLHVWMCWMKKYESATGMLCRSLENIDFAADDDVEFEVRQQLIRRRLVCEEVFDELEIIYPRVEELRKEKAGEVRVIAARIERALEAAIERAQGGGDETQRE